MLCKKRICQFFLSVVLLIFAFILGCSSPKTQITTSQSLPNKITTTPEIPLEEIIKYGSLCKINLSHITLPDESEVYLMPETDVEVVSIPADSTTSQGYEILLLRGKIIIISQLTPGTWFKITNQQGYSARLDGLLMIVEIVSETDDFVVTCIDGLCEVGTDPQSFNLIKMMHDGWLDNNGNFLGPFAISLDDLIEGCGEDYISTMEYPTSTPDLGATATAFCGDFEEENPGTPCP